MKNELKILLKDYINESNVLISIKPEFCEKIINGTKRFEYRRNRFTRKVSRIFIYETKPKGKIIGYFNFSNSLFDTPQKIWDNTKKYSGIKKSKFDIYCKNKENIFALEIKSFTIIKPEIDPFVLSNFKAPQSLIYF